MTKITPFAFPALERILKLKRFRDEFTQRFPQVIPYLNEAGSMTDRKAAFFALKPVLEEWLPWLETTYFELEQHAAIVRHFDASIAFHADSRKGTVATVHPKTQSAQQKGEMEVKGPHIWRELHRLALQWSGDKEDLRQIIIRITNSIPCGSCKAHWVEMITRKPPVVETAEALFALSVEWHNEVNARIGKPEMPLDEALKLYSAQS